MHSIRKITDDLTYLGVDDHRLHLFENIYPIPRGVSYNSYLLSDEKNVLIDTVDWSVCRQFMENLAFSLGGKKLDYVIIHHMEPDHAACLEQIILVYPEAKVISSEKSFLFMKQFGVDVGDRGIIVKEGDSMSFGKHTFAFVEAPMVHWPEVIVSFDTTTGTLFSADGFGSFGALDGALFNDEVHFDAEWLPDARRYFTNIVGKYGPHVQSVLRKASTLGIKMICPLHGPIWRNNLGYILDKYIRWSSYTPEKKGVLIPYASMYGNTAQAAMAVASRLIQKGCLDVKVCDVSTTDPSDLIALTFYYSHLLLVCPTYNLGIYPPMLNYLNDLKAHNMQNRTVAIIENGTWACTAGKLMVKELEIMKAMTILTEGMTISSSVSEANIDAIDEIAKALLESMEFSHI